MLQEFWTVLPWILVHFLAGLHHFKALNAKKVALLTFPTPQYYWDFLYLGRRLNHFSVLFCLNSLEGVSFSSFRESMWSLLSEVPCDQQWLLPQSGTIDTSWISQLTAYLNHQDKEWQPWICAPKSCRRYQFFFQWDGKQSYNYMELFHICTINHLCGTNHCFFLDLNIHFFHMSTRTLKTLKTDFLHVRKFMIWNERTQSDRILIFLPSTFIC